MVRENTCPFTGAAMDLVGLIPPNRSLGRGGSASSDSLGLARDKGASVGGGAGGSSSVASGVEYHSPSMRGLVS